MMIMLLLFLILKNRMEMVILMTKIVMKMTPLPFNDSTVPTLAGQCFSDLFSSQFADLGNDDDDDNALQWWWWWRQWWWWVECAQATAGRWPNIWVQHWHSALHCRVCTELYCHELKCNVFSAYVSFIVGKSNFSSRNQNLVRVFFWIFLSKVQNFWSQSSILSQIQANTFIVTWNFPKDCSLWSIFPNPARKKSRN